MFLRTLKIKGSKGVQYEYLRVIETYRDSGKIKHRTVFNIGRKDKLAPFLEDIVRVLQGDEKRLVAIEEVEPLEAWDYGPVLAARKMWGELGLEWIFDRCQKEGSCKGVSLSERAFVLVANRLCYPSSEHGLARWLETDFVCDREGRRWMPMWRDDKERKRSKRPRVRVEEKQLKVWYRTLDEMHKQRRRVEEELFFHLRDLFSLRSEIVFYDLTSTYFEGHGPYELAFHGYSRDGKPRNRQVLVGVVMVDGWPIAHHVFRGNLRDAQTLRQVVVELGDRFGFRRVVLVGDRGMVTSNNLEMIKQLGHGYLVGLNRRRQERTFNYIQKATEAWQSCPCGINAKEKLNSPQTLVQEVKSDEPGVRVFVVKSDERLQYEKGQRLKSMERVRNELEKLQKRVETGKLKAPQKIGAAAARMLSRNHGFRYYSWELVEGKFRYFEHPVNLKREETYEGTYVIQTEEKNLTAVEAVELYKQLSDVERAFCNLKDIIDMRPIWHKTPERVEAHIFVAALALLLHRGIEKKLKAAGLDLSSREALQILKAVRVVEMQVGEGITKRGITGRGSRVRQVLSALGITNTQPPTPHKGVKIPM